MGRPFFVHLAKILGACPRSARPYRIRDEQKRKLLPAENALVKIPALTIEGRTASERKREEAQISKCSLCVCMLLTLDAGTGHGDNVGRLSRGAVACSAKGRRVSIQNSMIQEISYRSAGQSRCRGPTCR